METKQDVMLITDDGFSDLQPRDLQRELANASRSDIGEPDSSSEEHESLNLTLKHKSSCEQLKLQLETSPELVHPEQEHSPQPTEPSSTELQGDWRLEAFR